MNVKEVINYVALYVYHWLNHCRSTIHWEGGDIKLLFFQSVGHNLCLMRCKCITQILFFWCMYFLAMCWVWYVKLYCAWSSFLQNWDRRIINTIYCYYYINYVALSIYHRLGRVNISIMQHCRSTIDWEGWIYQLCSTVGLPLTESSAPRRGLVRLMT